MNSAALNRLGEDFSLGTGELPEDLEGVFALGTGDPTEDLGAACEEGGVFGGVGEPDSTSYRQPGRWTDIHIRPMGKWMDRWTSDRKTNKNMITHR